MMRDLPQSDIASGIIATANALGIRPIDLATAISYETAGTFDPTKAGPRTKWGRHRGLIQFGEPQAKQYGVNWNDPTGSQLGPDGAVAKYLRASGVKPGMGLMDVYSAINAGGVGRYGASDAKAGGAPGSVADKVNYQMAGHAKKAQALLGGVPVGPPPAPMGTAMGAFGQPPAQVAQAPSQAPSTRPAWLQGLARFGGTPEKRDDFLSGLMQAGQSMSGGGQQMPMQQSFVVQAAPPGTINPTPQGGDDPRQALIEQLLRQQQA